MAVIDQLIERFSDLNDPRCPGKSAHRRIDILVVAICAVIACAESWADIAVDGRSKVEGLRQLLARPNGIASQDTLRRVFMLIDAEAFEARCTAWVGAFATPGEQAVVAIDGKTRRRSFDRGREQSRLPLGSAWARDPGLVLGPRRVAAQAHELTASPELLASLALENPLVSLEAMGCQQDSAQRMLERQADYRRVLKANHGNAYAVVQSHFELPCFARDATTKPVFDAVDESPGRRVRCRVLACSQAASLEGLAAWPQGRTVLAVEALRDVNGSGQGQAEIRYFLSRDIGDPPGLAQALRRHWAIENRRHWRLDVTFREDDSRLRDPTAVRHFALLRKIALHLIGHDRSTKASLRGKREKAAWDNDSRLQLLQANFMR